MKAICVVNESDLVVRDLPEPTAPADEHLLIKMEASAINPGDKYFLLNPASRPPISVVYDVWGASGAGQVIASGKNVPTHYQGKRVAIYRSLIRTPETLGLWCETAQVHHSTCLILPDDCDAQDYSGSLVNVMTAYCFLQQIIKEGHKGVVVTAGNSATGRALMQLAKDKNIPAIAIVRSQAQKDNLANIGFANVLDSTAPNFDADFNSLTQSLKTTAVFDGVGGDIVSRIAPIVPTGATFYFYGFLAGLASFTIQSRIMLEKNLVMRSFSNYMTETAQNRELLAGALTELSKVIANPIYRTTIGAHFKYDQIEAAIKYQGKSGSKCLLVPR